MLLERIEDPDLSQYSYLIGCPEAGAAAVVDPRRDGDVYVDLARHHDLQITHVLETHIHADFASGARALAEDTRAELVLSRHDEAERYEVAFPHTEIGDHDRIRLGSVGIEARHTPGHTPEHLAFLVYDTARSRTVPQLFLTGDFLFVGSLGRPDLLGEEAKRELAGRLFDSVRTVLPGLPDGLEVLPGHGAGSMCGSGMSGRPVSTLGFERAANPYLDPDLSEDAFIEKILGSAPPFPPYYRRMKELNASGPPPLPEPLGGRPVAPREAQRLIDEGHVVVDIRDQLAFGKGHVPGAFGIGGGGKLSTWAAWVVPYETPILLVARHPTQIEPAARALARVGLDDVRGWIEGGPQAWREAGLPLTELPQITPLELHRRRAKGEEIAVLDVRSDGEWRAGHIEGAVHVMGGTLPGRLDEAPGRDGPVAVVCGSGYRSTVAASVLGRAGFGQVMNVTGGMSAWNAAGLPTTAEG